MSAPAGRRLLAIQPVTDGGGSETALIEMVRELTGAGWEVHVAVPSWPHLAGRYEAAGARLHVVPMERLTTSGGPGRWMRFLALWPVSVARLARLGRVVGADLVHSNSLHSWYGWAAAAAIGKPHVWHAREIVFQSRAALRVERFLARRFATVVVAISSTVASQLDQANVVVVRDDADPERFNPGRAGRFRAAAGIPEGVPLIGSVARIDTWKGFDTLLHAFPAVAAARPDVRLVIAGGTVPGKEVYAEGLRRRAEQLGALWLGPRADVPELMADLDLFVQVSTEPEPFGLVVVEALASGVPVVAGAAGGPLEVLGAEAAAGPTEQGRLVPPDDPEALAGAILSLLPAGDEPGGSPHAAADALTAAGRRSRRPLRQPDRGRFAPLFEAVLHQ